MNQLAPPSVRLLVCGNADRGDDGAALSAVATLLPSLPSAMLERLEVRRCGHLRVEDLLDMPAGEICVLVDAAMGIAPGHVVTMPLCNVTGDLTTPTPRSSHELAIDGVLEETRTRRPGGIPDGSFVGIGGRRFGYGRPL
jgi:Ni,Fe-hydrogenase maturation factor